MADRALSEWLAAQQSEGYRNQCRITMPDFIRFLSETHSDLFPEGITGDSILALHKQFRESKDNKIKYFFDDVLSEYIQWTTNRVIINKKGKEKPRVSHNTAVNRATRIRGFFKYHRAALEIQRGKIQLKEKKKEFHTFKRDELAKMVSVGNLEEKVVLLLSKDLGLRVEDFVSLRRKPLLEAFKDCNGEFPIELEIETQKEGVVAVGHITEESWETLNLYWQSITESEYIFPSREEGREYISGDRANDIIKNTWRKAFPERKDVRVRFHEIRAFKITALTDSNVNEWTIKKLVGKKLPNDISTYVIGQNLKEAFMKAEERLRLTGNNGNGSTKLEELKKTVDHLEDLNTVANNRIERLIERLSNHETAMSQMAESISRLNILVNRMLEVGGIDPASVTQEAADEIIAKARARIKAGKQ